MKPFIFFCVLVSSLLSFAENRQPNPAVKSVVSNQETQSTLSAKPRSILIPRNPLEGDRMLQEAMEGFKKWIQTERQKAQTEGIAESLAILDKNDASLEELKAAYRELIETYERELNGETALEGVGEFPKSGFGRLSVLDGLVNWSDAVCKTSKSLGQMDELNGGFDAIERRVQTYLPGEKKHRKNVEAYEKTIQRIKETEEAWKNWVKDNAELIDAATEALEGVITFEDGVEEGMHRRLVVELIRRGGDSAKNFEAMWKREANNVRQRWMAERLQAHRADWEKAQQKKTENMSLGRDDAEVEPYVPPKIDIPLESIDMGFIDTNLLLAQFPVKWGLIPFVDPKEISIEKFNGGKLKNLVKVFEEIASSEGYSETQRRSDTPLVDYVKALQKERDLQARYAGYIEYARAVQAHLQGCRERYVEQMEIAKDLLNEPEKARIEQFVELKTNLEKIKGETEFKEGEPIDATLDRLKRGKYDSDYSTHKE